MVMELICGWEVKGIKYKGLSSHTFVIGDLDNEELLGKKLIDKIDAIFMQLDYEEMGRLMSYYELAEFVSNTSVKKYKKYTNMNLTIEFGGWISELRRA